MKSNQFISGFLRWILIAYLCLIVEKAIFTGVIEVFRASQGEESMGIGFFLINVFILPFIQWPIWQLGGNLAMVSMIAFACTSYMLSMKGLCKLVPTVLGSLAIVFSLLFNLTRQRTGIQLFAHSLSQILVVVLVSILGLNAKNIFDKLTGRASSES